MMNRRQLIGCALAIPFVAAADCRDENGMMNPDFEDMKCHSLTLFEPAVTGRYMRAITGTALFGFGTYETLLECQKMKETYTFKFEDKQYRIRVTRLSVDVNRHIGCVMCEVQGQVFS